MSSSEDKHAEKEDRRMRVEAMMRAMGLVVHERDPQTSPSSLSQELERIEKEKKQLEQEMRDLASTPMSQDEDPVSLLKSTATLLSTPSSSKMEEEPRDTTVDSQKSVNAASPEVVVVVDEEGQSSLNKGDVEEQGDDDVKEDDDVELDDDDVKDDDDNDDDDDDDDDDDAKDVSVVVDDSKALTCDDDAGDDDSTASFSLVTDGESLELTSAAFGTLSNSGAKCIEEAMPPASPSIPWGTSNDENATSATTATTTTATKQSRGHTRSNSDSRRLSSGHLAPVITLPSSISSHTDASKTVDWSSLFIMDPRRPDHINVRISVAGHRASSPRVPRGGESKEDSTTSTSNSSTSRESHRRSTKRRSVEYARGVLRAKLSTSGVRNASSIRLSRSSNSGTFRGSRSRSRERSRERDSPPSSALNPASPTKVFDITPRPVEQSVDAVKQRLQSLSSADGAEVRRSLVELKRGVADSKYVDVIVQLGGLEHLQNLIVAKSLEEKISRSVLSIALDVLLGVVKKNSNWLVVTRNLFNSMIPLISIDIMTVKTKALEVMALLAGCDRYIDFDGVEVDECFRQRAEDAGLAPYEDIAWLLSENNNASVVALEFLNNYLGRLTDDHRDTLLNALTDLSVDPAIAEMVRTSGEAQVRKEAHRFQAYRMTELLATVQPYDKENEYHEEMLLDLWETVFPEEPLESRVSNQWQKLGFQGKDPATDFRGMGLLGLHTLRHFALSNPDGLGAILTSQHNRSGKSYPVAVGGINITSMLFGLLMIGANPEDRPLFVFLLDDAYAFEIIFSAVFELFNEAFIMVDAGYMDFPNVFSGIEGRVQGILDVNPSSLSEFLSLVNETKKLKLKLEEMSMSTKKAKKRVAASAPKLHQALEGKYMSGRLLKKREEDKAREYGSTVKHLREVIEDRESVESRMKQAGLVNREQEKEVIASSVAEIMEGLSESETLSIVVKHAHGSQITLDVPRSLPVSDVTTLCRSKLLTKGNETGEELMKTAAGQFMMPYLPLDHYVPKGRGAAKELSFFFGGADELEALIDDGGDADDY